MDQRNSICISSFDANLDWFKDYDNPHVIFDTCHKGVKKSRYYPYDIQPSNLKNKYPLFNVIDGDIQGYNIYDYLTFIINNYECLPEVIVFIKGNILDRHVSREYFNRIIDNNYFTSIEDWLTHKELKLNSKNYFISSDGGWVKGIIIGI